MLKDRETLDSNGSSVFIFVCMLDFFQNKYVMFFHWVGDDFILTHGFVKKDQKTPKSEIYKAIRYRDDFLIAKGGNH
jgi:hypothetical protein